MRCDANNSAGLSNCCRATEIYLCHIRVERFCILESFIGAARETRQSDGSMKQIVPWHHLSACLTVLASDQAQGGCHETAACIVM